MEASELFDAFKEATHKLNINKEDLNTFISILTQLIPLMPTTALKINKSTDTNDTSQLNIQTTKNTNSTSSIDATLAVILKEINKINNKFELTNPSISNHLTTSFPPLPHNNNKSTTPPHSPIIIKGKETNKSIYSVGNHLSEENNKQQQHYLNQLVLTSKGAKVDVDDYILITKDKNKLEDAVRRGIGTLKVNIPLISILPSTDTRIAFNSIEEATLAKVDTSWIKKIHHSLVLRTPLRSNCIVVHAIPKAIQIEGIKDAFEEFGTVIKVRIIPSRSEASRCCSASVLFEDGMSVRNILNLEKSILLGGMKLTVEAWNSSKRKVKSVEATHQPVESTPRTLKPLLLPQQVLIQTPNRTPIISRVDSSIVPRHYSPSPVLPKPKLMKEVTELISESYNKQQNEAKESKRALLLTLSPLEEVPLAPTTLESSGLDMTSSPVSPFEPAIALNQNDDDLFYRNELETNKSPTIFTGSIEEGEIVEEKVEEEEHDDFSAYHETSKWESSPEKDDSLPPLEKTWRIKKTSTSFEDYVASHSAPPIAQPVKDNIIRKAGRAVGGKVVTTGEEEEGKMLEIDLDSSESDTEEERVEDESEDEEEVSQASDATTVSTVAELQ